MQIVASAECGQKHQDGGREYAIKALPDIKVKDVLEMNHLR